MRRQSREALGLRIVSAAVLAPAALGALYVGGAVFSAVVAFAAVVMVFEWARMVSGRDFSPAFFVLAAGASLALTLAASGQFAAGHGAALAAGAAAAWAGRQARGGFGWIAFGAPYILMPSVALIWLRNAVENGASLTLTLFLIVWAADIGGYAAGRLVGGPRMNPAISPAKTWAGAAGGLILGGLAGLVAARWLWTDGSALSYVALGACLGLASILGDMAESAMKRQFGVKDSSGFIPGHGGALDRLDGMIFATAALTLVLYIGRLSGGVFGQG